MGIYLNGDITANSIIINNMYSKIQTNTSQFLNVDADDFGSMLKKGAVKPEEKKEIELKKTETTNEQKAELKNEELKRMMNKSSMDRMMFEFSQGLNNLYSSPLVNGLAAQAVKAFV